MIEITDYEKLFEELNEQFDLTLVNSEMNDLACIVHRYSKPVLTEKMNVL